MRKGLLCVVLFLILSVLPFPGHAAPKVYVNGNLLKTDVPPVIKNDRVYVPMRGIFEALDISVMWQENPRRIILFSIDPPASWVINPLPEEAWISFIGKDKKIPIDPAPFVQNGRTLVPLRMISETLGSSVFWDSEEQTAYVDLRKELSVDKIINDNIDKIVTVYAGNKQGSGFYITTNGVIVSNRHVVTGSDTVTVRDFKGNDRLYRVRYESPTMDVAFLYPKIKFESPVVSWTKVRPACVNDYVVAMGSPQNLRNTSTTGKVTGFMKFDGVNLILTSAPIAPGSSGGALFDPEGNVIGVTSAVLATDKSVSVAIPIHSVQEAARQFVQEMKDKKK